MPFTDNVLTDCSVSAL